MDAKTLSKMTLPKLREEALKFSDIAGVHGMKKAELIEVLKQKYGIVEEKTESEMFMDKKIALKKRIRQAKAEREQTRKEKDKSKIKLLQIQLRKLRRRLRKLIKQAQVKA